MKTIKIVLVCMLSLILAISTLPSGVFAEDEPTVVAIEVADRTLYQYGNNGDGDWCAAKNEDGTINTAAWFKYKITPKEATVFFSNGTSFTGTPSEIYYETRKSISVTNPQTVDNPWDLGDYTVSYKFGEFTGTYTVSIVKAPIKSVAVQDLVLRQYVDGSKLAAGHFGYDIDPVVTVTFEDGTVVTGTRWEISKQTGYLPVTRQLSQDSELALGKYTAVLNYMDWYVDFNVTIVDAVTSIELVELPKQTVLPYSAYVDLSGGILRVHFSDGAYEDVELDSRHTQRKYSVTALGDDKHTLGVTPERCTVGGNQTITLDFLGETVSYDATVLPKADNLTLTANKDHTLSLLYTYGDHSFSMDLVDFSLMSGMWNSSDSAFYATGTLYTTGGTFYATLYKIPKNGTASITVGNGSEIGAYSVTNTITDTWWIDKHNGVVRYGDYTGNGITDSRDLRGLLAQFAGNTTIWLNTTSQHQNCEVNGDGIIDTTDARLILHFITQ